MLMRNSGALQRKCSNGWRVGYSGLMAMALAVMVGTIGVRRAQAQAADGDQKAAEVEKRTAQEQAAVAANREAELVKLRSQQEQILAQLKSLEVERQQLQDELAARKVGRFDAAADIAEKRLRLRREQAVAEEREAAAREMLARRAARQDFGPDGDIAVEEKANRDQAEMRDRISKKNPGTREQNEFVGRAQLDLVSLADRYADAVGNLQMAKLELDQLTATLGPEHKDVLAKSPALKIKVQIAERKVGIFRGIAQAAIESAKADLGVAMQQVKMGIAPTNAVSEPQARLRILEVILAQ